MPLFLPQADPCPSLDCFSFPFCLSVPLSDCESQSFCISLAFFSESLFLASLDPSVLSVFASVYSGLRPRLHISECVSPCSSSSSFLCVSLHLWLCPLPLCPVSSSDASLPVSLRAYALSRVRLFATPWAVALQAPLSVGFSRQEHWSGLPCPPPEDLPNLGTELTCPVAPALAGGCFTTVLSLCPSQSFALTYLPHPPHFSLFI